MEIEDNRLYVYKFVKPYFCSVGAELRKIGGV